MTRTREGSVALSCAAPLPGCDTPLKVKTYRRRWLILALYTAVMGVNCIPWMQYTVMTDVVTVYYGVSNEMVEWTAMIYNATAMLLTFPCAWLLDKYGLRLSILLAALGTFLGMWLKVLGCSADRFWWALLGQALVSMSNCPLACSPARVSAVWFPADEVSTALGSGMFGMMFGVAAGCAVAPLQARADWDADSQYQGFLICNLTLAVVSTVLLIAVFFLFTDKPALPPSPAQAAAQAAAAAPGQAKFLSSMLRICRDFNFLLLLVAVSLETSVYTAITTLLNRAIVEYFPGRGADAGWCAMLITLTGMGGIVVVSVVIDKTKKYKEISIGSFIGFYFCAAAYSLVIWKSTMTAVYWAAGLMGFFLTCYFISAFEYAVEITYPEPEGNPAALISWCMQPVSLLLTMGASQVFTTWGANGGHAMLLALLTIGLLATFALPRKYRRLEAEQSLAKLAEDKDEPKALLAPKV